MQRFQKSRVLMPLLVVAVAGCAKGPERTVENFYTAIEKGEHRRKRRGYPLEQPRPDVGRRQRLLRVWTRQHEEIVRCGGIKNIEVDLEGEGTFVLDGDCDLPGRLFR